MNSMNDVLSPKLKVPALRAGEVVTYRRLAASQLQDGEPVVLSDYWMSGRVNLIDPFDSNQRVKELLNIESWRTVKLPGGDSKSEPVVGMVKWPMSGEIIVGAEDVDRYIFLERHPRNLSNPYRNKKRKAIFFRVDDRKTVHDGIRDADLLTDALLWAKRATLTDLMAVAGKLPGLNADMDPENLKYQVMKVAQRNPRQLILATEDASARKLVLLSDAEKFRVIWYDTMERQWHHTQSGEKLCEVAVDTLPFDGLVNFFATDGGNKKFAAINKEMKELYQAVRA